MASKHLETLRSLPAQLAAAHKEYTQKFNTVRDNPYLDTATRQKYLRDLAAASQVQIAEIRAQASEAAASVHKATSTRIEPTDLARQRVLRAFDGGMTYQEIARLFADQKDRVGMAALKEAIPLEARAGKLGGKDHTDRRERDALDLVARMEKPLMEPAEQATYEEAREVGACMGLLENNLKRLDQHYATDQQAHIMGHQQPIESLYGWVGLPGQETNGQPYIQLEAPTANVLIS